MCLTQSGEHAAKRPYNDTACALGRNLRSKGDRQKLPINKLCSQKLVAKLEHMNDRQTLDTLLRKLSAGDREQQCAAAIAAGELGDRRAVPALVALLQTADDVFGPAQFAANALGEIGDPSSIDALIDALKHPYAAGQAAEALAKLKADRALPPLIERFEESHDPSLATLLGNWGDRRAVLSLVDAMKDPNPRVRFYSARALGKIGDSRAIPALENAVWKDTMPLTGSKSFRGKSVSYVAARALSRIRETDAERNNCVNRSSGPGET